MLACAAPASVRCERINPEENEPIDQISRMMDDLKQQVHTARDLPLDFVRVMFASCPLQAVDMGAALKGQSAQLDVLTSVTQDNTQHMVQTSQKARVLAGGRCVSGTFPAPAPHTPSLFHPPLSTTPPLTHPPNFLNI